MIRVLYIYLEREQLCQEVELLRFITRSALLETTTPSSAEYHLPPDYHNIIQFHDRNDCHTGDRKGRSLSLADGAVPDDVCNKMYNPPLVRIDPDPEDYSSMLDRPQDEELVMIGPKPADKLPSSFKLKRKKLGKKRPNPKKNMVYGTL
jgi:hypothetical protein